jgi:hypothetical protein
MCEKVWARVPHAKTRKKNISVNMYPETFNLRVTAERILDGAPAHCSRAARNVLSYTYHDRWIDRGQPHGLHARKIWILWFFLPVRTALCKFADKRRSLGRYSSLCRLKPLSWLLFFFLLEHLQSLVLAMNRHVTIALWMPLRLSVTNPASLNECGGPWRDVSRRALNLIKDIFSTLYKGVLPALTLKLNVLGHVSI